MWKRLLKVAFSRVVATLGLNMDFRSPQWRRILFIFATMTTSVQAAEPQDRELKMMQQELKVMAEQLRSLTEAYQHLQKSEAAKTKAWEERVQQLEDSVRVSNATTSTMGNSSSPSAAPTANRASSEVPAVRPYAPTPGHEHGQTHFDANEGLTIGNVGGPNLKLGANMDLLGAARNFGPTTERRQVYAREVELSMEAQVTDWLHAFIFMTRPNGESFTVEEAIAAASLPYNIQLKAGFYRPEFGYLNTVHEPERPQVSLPLPVTEFLGGEQLREGAVTVGKWFDLGGGHRAGFSGAVLNGDNAVALNGGNAKAYTGKVYYGRQTGDYAYQFGLSALTGKNDPERRLRTSAQVIDFRLFADPFYNLGYDYPSRFSLIGEVLFNQRASLKVDDTTGASWRNTNRAVGAWTIADYQFMPAHHVGLGVEFTQGRENKNQKGNAYSTHYSWYYTPHSRIQAQLRRVNSDSQGRGWEAMLQWNVVLGPHSERPFLPILPFEAEK